MLLWSVFLLSASFRLSTAALPNGWKPCKQSSSDLNACLQNEIVKALKTLKNGDKKLGVLPVDPLVIEKLQINQGSGPVSIKMTLQNLKFEGLTDLKYLDLKNDQWKQIKSKIFIKKLVNTGAYKIEGKILTLPVNGEGPCTIIWDEVNADIDHVFNVIDKKGKKYLQTKSFKVNLKPKKVQFKFENLFNGNKQLGDTTNAFVNENWEQIMTEVNPAIEQAINQVFARIADQVLGKIPMDEIVVN